MSKSFKECAVEIAKEAAWAGFVVAATTAVELTLSEIRNNSQDDDDDEDDDDVLGRLMLRVKVILKYAEKMKM